MSYLRCGNECQPPKSWHVRGQIRRRHLRGKTLDSAWPLRCPERMPGTLFVGRHSELERLVRVLRGDDDAVGAALVLGDAGIGKTRLLAEVVRAAPDVQVLAG